MPRLTPYTVADPAQFRDVLAEVRDNGWSMVINEREEGLISLAAPIRDHDERVVAAVASSTSTGRATPEGLREDVVPALLETAKQISAELGNHQTLTP